MTTIRTLAAASVALLTCVAAAQDLGIKAPPQQNPIAILGATVHTISGETIEDGAVWFHDGQIGGVLTREQFELNEQRVRRAKPLTRIDAKGKHVYPGLISPYTQLGLSEIQAVPASIDTSETGNITPEVRATIAVNPDSTLIPVTRSNGILTAGVFPVGGVISGQAGVIRLDGWTMEEMAVLPSAGLVIRWPSMRTISAWWMETPEDEQRRNAERNVKAISDAFDTAEAYALARDADPSLPVDLRWEAVRSVLKNSKDQRAVYIAASELDQITSAVTFAVERGLKPALIGGRDAPLAADLLKKHDIPVIVLSTHVMPRRDDAPYDDGYTLPARLAAAGLRFSIATNDDTAHERNLPYVAAMAAAHGLSPDAALRCITLDAAEILGVGDRLGSLEEGKAATLIITTGSPLEVTTKIERAFIDGREIDLSNKHTKLGEKYRERYKQGAVAPNESR